MRPVRLKEISPEDLARIKQRAAGEFDSVSERARQIMTAVRDRGDAAVREFTLVLDKVELTDLEATPQELAEAYQKATPELIAALDQMVANITAFHRTHVRLEEEHVETVQGVELWRVWRAIERVGLYVPGGRSPLPSSLLMTALPASIAGCR